MTKSTGRAHGKRFRRSSLNDAGKAAYDDARRISREMRAEKSRKAKEKRRRKTMFGWLF